MSLRIVVPKLPDVACEGCGRKRLTGTNYVEDESATVRALLCYRCQAIVMAEAARILAEGEHREEGDASRGERSRRPHFEQPVGVKRCHTRPGAAPCAGAGARETMDEERH